MRSGLALGMLALAAGCGFSPPTAGTLSPAEKPSIKLTIEPDAPIDDAPPILRIHARLPAATDLTRIALVDGDVGAGRLRELATGDISAALRAKMIDALVFRDDSDVIVAPAIALEPGRTYSVASGDPPLVAHFRVTGHDDLETLERAWPPVGSSGTRSLAIWCGSHPLPSLGGGTSFDPGGIDAVLAPGAIDGIGERCVRADIHASDEPRLVPPPTFTAGAWGARVDPSPIAIDGAMTSAKELACGDHELAFGAGCARAEDDRVIVRTPAAPLLWAIGGDGVDVVSATAPSDGFVLPGFVPKSTIALRVRAIDAAGNVLRSTFQTTMKPPEPHLVINEVLADPLGPEPSQEWVELVNDGTIAAHLGGYRLADEGGETALPDALIEPGRFVLIVNDAFVADDGLDPAPAPSSLLIRVPKLGKNGLANAGETIRLVDVEGSEISRVPSEPKPKPGKSVARIHPWDADDSSASFRIAAPTPGFSN